MSNFYTPGGAALSSNSEEWETPRALFEELNKEFNFTLDAASSDLNAKVERHYTKEDDGLSKDWSGETVFLNPPYGRNIKAWIKKAYEESKNATIVLLIPARTDTSYFHDYILDKAEIRFIRGRLRFEMGGVVRDPAPFPSMIVIYKP